MATEQTYIMVKPDGVERGLVGEIVKRFEQRGYKLVALELMHPTKEMLEEHYGDLKTKSFFPKLVTYMLSGPVVGMGTVSWLIRSVGRQRNRRHWPKDAWRNEPFELFTRYIFFNFLGSIRGDYCIDIGKNICHGSDSVEAAKKEIALWFPRGVTSVARQSDRLIYE